MSGAAVIASGKASKILQLVEAALDAHRLGGAAFMHLAAGQQEAQRPAERVSEQMDLGRQSTSGTPQSLVRSPFLAAPLPVAACW